MSAILTTEMGTVTYSDDFIGTIAGQTATECYGVVGMAPARMTDSIVGVVKKDNVKKGIRVFTDETNALRIDLNIIVEYGISIYAAASSIIETVRYNVEKYTGLTVRDVNIIVSGVRVQDK